MTEEIEFHVKFPVQSANFMNNELTFSINHIKSRELCTAYFTFKAFGVGDNLLHTHISDRWIIDNIYRHKEENFTIPQSVVDSCTNYQITLIIVQDVEIASENPVFFNEAMFQEGEFVDYHIPSEVISSWEVKFNKNSFANLYSNEGISLQVIRPLKDSFMTNKLTKSECTVLAPHLYNEPSVDNPTNVFLEFINQTEQRIDVLR